ncbi:hypothetical protein D3C72_2349410 [compost metagenome]
MTIDVPALSSEVCQFVVILSSEQTDIIDLRYAWCKELNRPCCKIRIIISVQRIIECAADLMDIKTVFILMLVGHDKT